MNLRIVYLYICPILKRVTDESFKKDIDLNSVKLADIVQEIFSKFIVNLTAEKSINDNYLSWVGSDLCFAFTVGTLSQSL